MTCQGPSGWARKGGDLRRKGSSCTSAPAWQLHPSGGAASTSRDFETGGGNDVRRKLTTVRQHLSVLYYVPSPPTFPCNSACSLYPHRLSRNISSLLQYMNRTSNQLYHLSLFHTPPRSSCTGNTVGEPYHSLHIAPPTISAAMVCATYQPTQPYPFTPVRLLTSIDPLATGCPRVCRHSHVLLTLRTLRLTFSEDRQPLTSGHFLGSSTGASPNSIRFCMQYQLTQSVRTYMITSQLMYVAHIFRLFLRIP